MAARAEILTVAKRAADAPVLVAIRESLPWSLIGLGVGLLAFVWIVPAGNAQGVRAVLARIALAEQPAFGLMALALAGILGARLAHQLRLDARVLVPATLVAFLAGLPPRAAGMAFFPYLAEIGKSGLFEAILVALALAAVSIALRRAGLRAAPELLAASIVVGALAGALALHLSLGAALIALLQPLGRLGDSFAALAAIVVVETALWLIGIHGPAALAAIVTPVYLSLQMQNTAAFAAHQPLPHIVVVSLFLFVFPGGAGATLPLAMMLACSRVQRLRAVGRLSVVPAIFNFNEPLLFGLPLAYSPYFAVPFVAVPLLTACTSYAAIAAGWVARPAYYVPSSLPAPISVYLATFDLRAIALVAVNIAIAAIVYWPFFRAYERDASKEATA